MRTIKGLPPKKGSSFPRYKRVARNWKERLLFLMGWKGIGTCLLQPPKRYGKHASPLSLNEAWNKQMKKE